MNKLAKEKKEEKNYREKNENCNLNTVYTATSYTQIVKCSFYMVRRSWMVWGKTYITMCLLKSVYN